LVTILPFNSDRTLSTINNGTAIALFNHKKQTAITCYKEQNRDCIFKDNKMAIAFQKQQDCDRPFSSQTIKQRSPSQK